MKKIDEFRPKSKYDRIQTQRETDGILFSELFADEFAETHCPACGLSGDYLFKKWGFEHKHCPHCLTVYVSPRPAEDLLMKYYNDFPAPNMWTQLLLATDSERKRLQYFPRLELILGQIALNSNGVAVDVGAGSGAFCLALKDSKKFTDVIALDISKESNDACRNIGLSTLCGSVSDLAPNSVDFLSMNDLIEHLYCPEDVLKLCFNVLTPGGVISIATPNGEGFDFKILGSDAPNIVPPEHINYFNTDSIRILLQRCGFEDIKVSTPGQLDIEIVCRAIENAPDILNDNKWVAHLVSQNEMVLRSFQEFLSINNLSSHMLVTAVKK